MFNQLTSICVLFYLNAEVFCSSPAKQCPSDKYYDPKIYNCTDCPSGYYGSNCSNSCRYPSYGVECQEKCQCAKKACDHVFGCSSYELNDCPSGYYGSNCSNSCRYPSYGVECQEKCQCAKKACDHVFGCSSYELNGHHNDNGLQLIVGLTVGIGVVLVIAAFLVINIANRRFYTRHIRENAHYIGSVVTEHSITTDMYKPPESSNHYCIENEATDSGLYMLAGTLRYEHVNLQ